MKSIQPILISDLDTGSAIDLLDRYGICVVKDFLDEDKLRSLNDEFDSVFAASAKENAMYSLEKHPTNQDGMVARFKTEKLGSNFEVTRSIFLSEYMKEVSRRYFETDCLVNDDVFFTNEKAADTPILPWHFDRMQSLKFYINLVDVDETNGAFEFDLGSHREGHFRANYYILSGLKVGEIPNDIPENELHNPTVISVNAGDLVIFDADGFHRGGVVSSGNERRVVRGHSHPIPNRGYVAKRFDSHWWLQKPVNLAKHLSPRSGRILPPGRLTNSTLTRG